jgi:hypothetical protein
MMQLCGHKHDASFSYLDALYLQRVSVGRLFSARVLEYVCVIMSHFVSYLTTLE